MHRQTDTARATARQAGTRLPISHIHHEGDAPDHAMEHNLDMFKVARKHDADIDSDRIPHDCVHTMMATILPNGLRQLVCEFAA